MEGLRLQHNVHIGGTLAANQKGAVKVTSAGLTLIDAQAGGSNENNGKLTIGIGGAAADDDAILKAADIGDSSDPAVFTVKEFDGVLADAIKVTPPHFKRGEIIIWGLDFDGAGGTAVADFDLVLTFLEG